jgi:hypothetical protein
VFVSQRKFQKWLLIYIVSGSSYGLPARILLLSLVVSSSIDKPNGFRLAKYILGMTSFNVGWKLMRVFYFVQGHGCSSFITSIR